MVLDDATLGKLVLIIFGILYFYYTIWIYILPFADDEDYIVLFFPPIKYALIIPALMGTLFVGTLIIFTLVTYFFF